MISEKESIEEACMAAQRGPRPAGCLPHWLRCMWVRGDYDAPGPKQRCRLGENHPGEHQYE